MNKTTQRGFTLIGLLFWAELIGFIALLAMRVFPSVNEYLTIKRAVDKIVVENPATVPEVRAAFDRQKEIEYSIATISGKDLDVTKENDRIVIRFAYDKQIELFDPVYLLIKYAGRSR